MSRTSTRTLTGATPVELASTRRQHARETLVLVDQAHFAIAEFDDLHLRLQQLRALSAINTSARGSSSSGWVTSHQRTSSLPRRQAVVSPDPARASRLRSR